jgi:hypothetical protein
MKVFVWKRIEHATQNYHTEGGVVVFAATEERARELAAQNQLFPHGCEIKPEELPDDVRNVAPDSPEAVYIFPDAGCC